MTVTLRSFTHARRLALVVAFAFGVTSAGWLAVPSTALAWDAGTFSSASEQELVALTNQTRAAAGLRTLKVDAALRSIARSRSKDMIQRDYFSHDIPPSGKTVFDVMQDKGYCFTLAGENIGWNTYPDDQATATIHQMFLDSPGHRSNIVGKRWEAIGIGAYKGPGGKKMWTVLFADKCGGSAPKATPKPKPKPQATPRPKPRATPRPASTPRPQATPRPTPRPTPVPTPTPTPPPPPTLRTGLVEPGDAVPATAGAAVVSFRVDDPPTARGLIDSIVGDVAGSFFGS